MQRNLSTIDTEWCVGAKTALMTVCNAFEVYLKIVPHIRTSRLLINRHAYDIDKAKY